MVRGLADAAATPTTVKASKALPAHFELPAGYNAAGISNLSEADWARVHIAHPLGRGGCGGPHPARTSAPECRKLIHELDAEAAALLSRSRNKY